MRSPQLEAVTELQVALPLIETSPVPESATYTVSVAVSTVTAEGAAPASSVTAVMGEAQPETSWALQVDVSMTSSWSALVSEPTT